MKYTVKAVVRLTEDAREKFYRLKKETGCDHSYTYLITPTMTLCIGCSQTFGVVGLVEIKQKRRKS